MYSINNITKNVCVNGKQKTILNNISFSIQDHVFLSIIGPSGCGKTTLLKILAGLDDKIEVDIFKDKRVLLMFQNTFLLPWRTTLKNIELSNELENNSITQQTNNLLEETGLSSYAKYFPKQLSGGMNRRLYLAQCLNYSPDILLLDEPFTGLDYETKKTMRTLLSNFKDSITIIMATHDIEDAIILSDQIILISKTPSEVEKIIDVTKINCKSIEFLDVENEIYSTFNNKFVKSD